MNRLIGYAVLGAAATVVLASPAYATTTGHRITYVRAGSVYVLSGGAETRLTSDSDDTRPRWSPEGGRIAYGHAGRLWVMNADGSGKRALTAGTTGGAAWSPDGLWLAFAARGCTGVNGVFKISATGGAPVPLFPLECRGKPAPAAPPAGRPAGDLNRRLRADGSVAWSPDGTRIAFPGGGCLGTFDDCLTVGTVATGTEQLVAGYGGGGVIFSGFAVVPAWSPDGRQLSWTAEDDQTPIHVVEADPGTSSSGTVGVPLDRELSFAGAGTAVLTGQYHGASWVIAVDLATGARTPLRQGSQPDAT